MQEILSDIVTVENVAISALITGALLTALLRSPLLLDLVNHGRELKDHLLSLDEIYDIAETPVELMIAKWLDCPVCQTLWINLMVNLFMFGWHAGAATFVTYVPSLLLWVSIQRVLRVNS